MTHTSKLTAQEQFYRHKLARLNARKRFWKEVREAVSAAALGLCGAALLAAIISGVSGGCIFLFYGEHRLDGELANIRAQIRDLCPQPTPHWTIITNELSIPLNFTNR